MKIYALNVQQFMQMHKIDDIPCLNYNFVDTMALLYYLRNTLPLVKQPINFTCIPQHNIQLTSKNMYNLRPYQMDVVKYVVNANVIKPTLVVMPCGSGKTFTSCCILCETKQRSLIITNYKIVASQWKRELLENFDMKETQIQCISDDTFTFEVKNPPDITIITYDTLASLNSPNSRKLIMNILLTKFTHIFLDEAHKAVASNYFCMISRLSGSFLALTATPVREDSEIQLLKQLVSYEKVIFAEDLIEQGYIAKIICSTVILPMPSKLLNAKLTPHQSIVAAVLNPNKLSFLMYISKQLLSVGKKIMLYCDNIYSLKFIYEKMKTLFPNVFGPISMETTQNMREKYIQNFMLCAKGSIIFVSRTGDEGLDIPCANTLIQICTSWGSRRQHAQRVGRIQRPFSVSTSCHAITIVSDRTSEKKFAMKRDVYLEKMKYMVNSVKVNKVIANDIDINDILKIIKKCNNTKHIKKRKQKDTVQKRKSNIDTLRKKFFADRKKLYE